MLPDPDPDAGAILSHEVVALDGKMAAVQLELPPLKLTVSGAVAGAATETEWRSPRR